YHASLAAYGTAGVRLEESNPWMQNEEVFRVGPVPQGTVSRPEKISGAQPYYPAKDRAALVEGVIVSELLIEKDGRITQPRVLQSLSPGLDLQALVTFCDWRFKPATLDGKPVRVYYMLTTSFEVR
ncbi:MAG TPA: energy transducer TonB, partial [Thermoanaerobaculia bacterium]|nr:energy transducer TonB [Thermoanaerobaculia bacterium]